MMSLEGFILMKRNGEALCVLVSPEDFDRVESGGPWQATLSRSTTYMGRQTRNRAERRTREQLHRFILGLRPGDGLEVDHVNGNGLDNRRENLRCVSRAQQMENRKKCPGKTSRYRGVSWRKDKRKWEACVNQGDHKHYLGCFASEEEAARVAAKARAQMFTHVNEARHPVPGVAS